MDDRFLMSFVCNEPERKGKELSLTSLDVAVLQLFGLFLARGDIFNYRGERITGNFMADYAGEVVQKAKVKFTGEKKKLTYTTSTKEQDQAGRDEAVRDYLDFIFHIYNNLPLPKRISPRKISVFLDYCILETPVRTAIQVLKHVLQYDFSRARSILMKLSGRRSEQVVKLIGQAMDADKQIANRYRKNLEAAVRDIMGRDFVTEALEKGYLGSGIERQPKPDAHDTTKHVEDEDHDYFDV